MDEEDSSVTRPPELFRAIFARVRDYLCTLYSSGQQPADSFPLVPPTPCSLHLPQANMEIYKEFKQNKFPAELFDVHMFALRPRDLARSDLVNQ